jgi:hypothetical protein
MDGMKTTAVEMPACWTPRKTKGRFPSVSTVLENRCAIPTFPQPLRLLKVQNRFRKEAWRPVASLPPSGSFFDEKMLGGRNFVQLTTIGQREPSCIMS